MFKRNLTKILGTAAIGLISLAGIAYATAPVITIDPIGPLVYAIFPQVYNVTGTIQHDPNISSVSELKLLINGVQEGATVNPNGNVTSQPFSLPWNILAAGTYDVKVSARHGNDVGSGEILDVIVSTGTGQVVVSQCPAAPAIAGAYMRSHVPPVKEGSANWKKVINNIASRTGSKGDLWAANACNPGYAAQVQAAVNVLLGW